MEVEGKGVKREVLVEEGVKESGCREKKERAKLEVLERD